MADDRNRIREIAWMELFPWLGLVRAVRLAFAPRMLLLAAVGLGLTTVGWGGLSYVFFGDRANRLAEETDPSLIRAYNAIEAWSSDPVQRNHNSDVLLIDRVPKLVRDEVAVDLARAAADKVVVAVDGVEKPFDMPSVSISVLDPANSQATLPWNMLSEPFRRLFGWETTWTSFFYLFLCGLWAVIVWSVFGGAITRSAAVWFAREDRFGLRASFSWGLLKWPSYTGAALFPLLGALGATIVPLALSWMAKWDFGLLLVSLMWPIVLFCGFVLAILLVGFLFGWPLMWPTISAEGTDSFDALSRSYSYTYQRPVHYLFYAAVAGVLGALAWIVVMIFANGVINYSFWAASWGSGVERIREIQNAMRLESIPDESWSFVAGVNILRFWIYLVQLVAVGFLFSYFWCAATYVYFLLRQAVDATEMDEVAIDDEPEVYGLPPMKTQPGAVPQIDDTLPATPSASQQDGAPPV